MTSVIVGGGISGLSVAYYLLKLRNGSDIGRIVLLEASDRLGGWIRSHRNSASVFEIGPHTVRSAGFGGLTLNLVEELGLSDLVLSITKKNPYASKRLILADDTLYRLPNQSDGLSGILLRRPPFKWPLAWCVIRDFFTPAVKCDDCSVYDFIRRRFGADAADWIADPLVRGVCAGDARLISADAFLTKPLFQREQRGRGGSVILSYLKDYFQSIPNSSNIDEDQSHGYLAKKAMNENWTVWTLKNGLESLIEKMHEKLIESGVEIITGYSVADISYRDKFSLRLNPHKPNINFGHINHIFITSPAYITAKILSSFVQTSALLNSIPFVSVIVIHIEFDGILLDETEAAFGFLVPSNQKQTPIMGVIYDTCSFPQGDRTIFTVMMNDQVTFDGNKDISHQALYHLRKILGFSSQLVPTQMLVSLLKDCIPQYTIGHRARVELARNSILNKNIPLSLVGASYDGVGINDCIYYAKEAVKRII